MKLISRSLEETKKIAEQFLTSVKPSDRAVIVALFGDLGAGKTAFVKKCAEILGIKETIISPTFVIEKIYRLPKNSSGNWKHLVHIDAYRFESAREMKHLGFEELLKESGNIIFIEWPERILEALPSDRKEIRFEFIDEEGRSIEIIK